MTTTTTTHEEVTTEAVVGDDAAAAAAANRRDAAEELVHLFHSSRGGGGSPASSEDHRSNKSPPTRKEKFPSLLSSVVPAAARKVAAKPLLKKKPVGGSAGSKKNDAPKKRKHRSGEGEDEDDERATHPPPPRAPAAGEQRRQDDEEVLRRMQRHNPSVPPSLAQSPPIPQQLQQLQPPQGAAQGYILIPVQYLQEPQPPQQYELYKPAPMSVSLPMQQMPSFVQVPPHQQQMLPMGARTPASLYHHPSQQLQTQVIVHPPHLSQQVVSFPQPVPTAASPFPPPGMQAVPLPPQGLQMAQVTPPGGALYHVSQQPSPAMPMSQNWPQSPHHPTVFQAGLPPPAPRAPQPKLVPQPILSTPQPQVSGLWQQPGPPQPPPPMVPSWSSPPLPGPQPPGMPSGTSSSAAAYGPALGLRPLPRPVGGATSAAGPATSPGLVFSQAQQPQTPSGLTARIPPRSLLAGEAIAGSTATVLVVPDHNAEKKRNQKREKDEEEDIDDEVPSDGGDAEEETGAGADGDDEESAEGTADADASDGDEVGLVRGRAEDDKTGLTAVAATENTAPQRGVDDEGNIIVTDTDILLGRGHITNNHKGNRRFRDIVALYRPDYVRAHKVQKPAVARVVVRAIRNGNPPGRFLRKDDKTGKWIDVGDKKAAEKTSQALRERV